MTILDKFRLDHRDRDCDRRVLQAWLRRAVLCRRRRTQRCSGVEADEGRLHLVEAAAAGARSRLQIDQMLP